MNTAPNTLRPKQNDCYFTDDVFKCIFLNENSWILNNISLISFLGHDWQFDNMAALVQIMAWCRLSNRRQAIIWTNVGMFYYALLLLNEYIDSQYRDKLEIDQHISCMIFPYMKCSFSIHYVTQMTSSHGHVNEMVRCPIPFLPLFTGRNMEQATRTTNQVEGHEILKAWHATECSIPVTNVQNFISGKTLQQSMHLLAFIWWRIWLY